VAGFCAANAPTDMAAAKAALLVINANRFFTEPFLSFVIGVGRCTARAHDPG